MTTCIGWLFDISIEHNHAVLWIKTSDKKILKLIDSYQPKLYVLPRNGSAGLQLFQVLSQQSIVDKVRWEQDKFTNLFEYDCVKKQQNNNKKEKLICVYPQSVQYYLPLLKMLQKDQRVKQLFNTDLSHIQQYLFTKLRIEPTSKVEVEHEGNKLYKISKIDDEQEVCPPPFSLLYFDVQTFSGKFTLVDPIRAIKVSYQGDAKEKDEKQLFNCKDSDEVVNKGYENALLLVTNMHFVLAINLDMV